MFGIDNTTVSGVISEGLIQTIFWGLFIHNLTKYAEKWLKGKTFYERLDKFTQDGKKELLGMIGVIPQHTLSALLLYVGYKFNRNDIFRSGCLAEFGYELYDLTQVYIRTYFGEFSGNKHAKAGVIMLTCHHLGGILLIIPALLSETLSNDIYFKEFALSLLFLTPLQFLFYSLYKTCDIYELCERTQFTVYYLLTFLILIYSRFIWTPMVTYNFFIYTFHKISFIMKIGAVLYIILINLFNLLSLLAMFFRGYEYMFSKSKSTQKIIRENEIKKLAKSQKLPNLIRSRSAPQM